MMNANFRPWRRARALLLASAGLVALAGCTTGPGRDPTSAARAPVAGHWSAQLAAADPVLLADRLTWGADPATVARIREQGAGAWIDAQLAPGPVRRLDGPAGAIIFPMQIERRPVDELARELEAQRKAFEAEKDAGQREKDRHAWQEAMNAIAREAATRQALRAIAAPDQVREQMTWFWMNHFSVFQQKHLNRALVGDYESRLRAAALGNFHDLLTRSVTHPAMLFYLDNHQNAAGHLNENYARELLELHTLGVDGGYTQRDVQELARVLTGLGVEAGPRRRDSAEGLATFRPQRHDAGDKELLGQHLAGSRDGELVAALQLIADHPSTARHVSRQLVRFWVGEGATPRLEQAAAQTFSRTRGDIPSVLRTIFDSPEFVASLGRRFKDPVHYVFSAVRLAADGRGVRDAGPVLSWINRLGEGYAGHSTPDGYPLADEDWNGPGQLAVRLEVARSIAGDTRRLFEEPAATAPGGTGGNAMGGGDERNRNAAGAATDAGGARTGKPSGKVERFSESYVRELLLPRMAPATRDALAQANSPREWNQMLLSSPEFMMH